MENVRAMCVLDLDLLAEDVPRLTAGAGRQTLADTAVDDERIRAWVDQLVTEKAVPAIAEAWGEGIRQGRARGFAEGLARARQIEDEG
ncbi:hypothetical protein [Micromonospora rosaria]|uniref:hypothetical protein n=1 Tax=Micromonospora rosaria TaxID=47874 RepID=UPI0012FCB801|nr:hypothetical protein [Micromonospora rosaria]